MKTKTMIVGRGIAIRSARESGPGQLLFSRSLCSAWGTVVMCMPRGAKQNRKTGQHVFVTWSDDEGENWRDPVAHGGFRRLL